MCRRNHDFAPRLTNPESTYLRVVQCEFIGHCTLAETESQLHLAIPNAVHIAKLKRGLLDRREPFNSAGIGSMAYRAASERRV